MHVLGEMQFLLRMYGSVVPRCLFLSVLGAVEGVVARVYVNFDPDAEPKVWQHPYTIAMFATVLGFSLVMRIQIAYQRYWEAASNCHRGSCKLIDAAVQLFAFDELSPDGFQDSGLAFRISLIHLTSLLFAIAAIDMRQDDLLFAQTDMLPTLSGKDSFQFRLESDGAAAADAPAAETARVSLTMASKARGVGFSGSIKSDVVSLRGLLQARRMQRHEAEAESEPAPRRQDRVSYVCNHPTDGEEAALRRLPPRNSTNNQSMSKLATIKSLPSVRTALVNRRQSCNSHDWMLRRGQLGALEYVGQTVFMLGSTLSKQELATANSFDVLGGVSQSERVVLSETPPGERVFLVHSWIVREVTLRHKEGGLAIAPPVLSRTYHILSEALVALEEAYKISTIDFPFPIRQLIAFLLLVFQGLAPLCIAAFMNSLPLVAILSFFVCLGYIALNETARELEMPFGVLANNLRVRQYQSRLNSTLAKLLDLWIPNFFEDESGEVGYDSSCRSLSEPTQQPYYSRKPRRPSPSWSSCDAPARMWRKGSLHIFPRKDSYQPTSPCAIAALHRRRSTSFPMEKSLGAVEKSIGAFKRVSLRKRSDTGSPASSLREASASPRGEMKSPSAKRWCSCCTSAEQANAAIRGTLGGLQRFSS